MPGKYSRQLIVDGFRHDNERQRARYLADKAAAAVPPLPTESVLFPRRGEPGYLAARYKLHTALKRLDKNSRLYLIGHGNWRNQTLGGVDADTWAKTLIEGGMPQVRVVSITGCQAGRDLGTANDMRVTYSANSFASKLHKTLGKFGVKVPLYARVYRIRIRSGRQVGVRGSKFTEGEHHRQNAKMLFDWASGSQTRKWVDYASADDPDSWVDLDDWVFLKEMGGMAA